MTLQPFPNATVIGSEGITIDNTAGGKSLTAAQYQQKLSDNDERLTDARYALITVETQPVRVNINPAVTVTDTTNGIYCGIFDSLWLTNPTQIRDCRIIRATGSSGLVQVTYFY